MTGQKRRGPGEYTSGLLAGLLLGVILMAVLDVVLR